VVDDELNTIWKTLIDGESSCGAQWRRWWDVVIANHRCPIHFQSKSLLSRLPIIPCHHLSVQIIFWRRGRGAVWPRAEPDGRWWLSRPLMSINGEESSGQTRVRFN